MALHFFLGGGFDYYFCIFPSFVFPLLIYPRLNENTIGVYIGGGWWGVLRIRMALGGRLFSAASICFVIDVGCGLDHGCMHGGN